MSVGVHAHVQIVVQRLRLDDHVEVSRLKGRVEDQLVLTVDLGVHPSEGRPFVKGVR